MQICSLIIKKRSSHDVREDKILNEECGSFKMLVIKCVLDIYFDLI